MWHICALVDCRVWHLCSRGQLDRLHVRHESGEPLRGGGQRVAVRGIAHWRHHCFRNIVNVRDVEKVGCDPLRSLIVLDLTVHSCYYD